MSALTARPGPPALADLVTVALARSLVAAAGAGVRVVALTSPLSLIAALVAQRTGADGLALAPGLGILDAVGARVSLTGGEGALGVDGAARGPASDTFVALARGRVAVTVTPAQLDARGAVNLSGIGGTASRPKIALPGHRGLAENNHSASTVIYLLTGHSPRVLVHRVDVESGSPPPQGRRRLLLTPLGVFELEPPAGWRIASLTPGSTVEEVAAATGFPMAADDPPATPAPNGDEAAALIDVDPLGVRTLPFLERTAAAARTAEIAAAEQAVSATQA